VSLLAVALVSAVLIIAPNRHADASETRAQTDGRRRLTDSDDRVQAAQAQAMTWTNVGNGPCTCHDPSTPWIQTEGNEALYNRNPPSDTLCGGGGYTHCMTGKTVAEKLAAVKVICETIAGCTGISWAPNADGYDLVMGAEGTYRSSGDCGYGPPARGIVPTLVDGSASSVHAQWECLSYTATTVASPTSVPTSSPTLSERSRLMVHAPAGAVLCDKTRCEVDANNHTVVYDWHQHETKGDHHHCVSDVSKHSCHCYCGNAATMDADSRIIHDVSSGLGVWVSIRGETAQTVAPTAALAV
jgi:hypothetical protein